MPSVFRNGAAIGQYQLPQDDGRAIIRSWMDETESDVAQGQDPLTTTVLHAAQRSDVPMLVTGKDEYVLGRQAPGTGTSWSPVYPSLQG